MMDHEMNDVKNQKVCSPQAIIIGTIAWMYQHSHRLTKEGKRHGEQRKVAFFYFRKLRHSQTVTLYPICIKNSCDLIRSAPQLWILSSIRGKLL
ncbi:MAG TPA: hypothetical protein DIT32_08325 [Peptococcaceae bacterium]|nr:hypothetical protein [Peptococcaceae bacterium]